MPFTYGGDDRTSKEEAAAEVPVARVGGVAFGVHAFYPGFHDDLRRSGTVEEEGLTITGKLSTGCFHVI